MSGGLNEEASRRELRCGRVALLGWTNVGKSTLLNQLVGDKLAAVADVAQTTRRRIVGVRSVAGKGQIAFVDTPGIHRPQHRMNRRMVRLARETLRGVDLGVLIIDASRGPGAGDRDAAAMLRRAELPALAVLNKIDRVHPKSKLLPMMQLCSDDLGFPGAVPVSARTGEGCPQLLDRLFAALPVQSPLFPEDYLTDQPERELAAEWIREKLLRATRQELPHATAVIVDSWEVREDGLLEIMATVIVERESQKKIVIGSQGAVLKRVGTEARVELENFLERRIYLGLHVKVCRDWRDDDRVLRDLGLS